MAQLLGVRRSSDTGYVILGANDLGRALGRALRQADQDVLFLESNPDACRAAEAEGFRVLYGIGLDDSLLQRAELDGRAGAVAVTPNDGINLHFARKARDDFKVSQVWVALRRGHMTVTKEMIHEARCRVLFDEPRSLELWTLRLERGLAVDERWRRTTPPGGGGGEKRPSDLENILLRLTVRRGQKIFLMDEDTSFRENDEMTVLVFEERRDKAHEWLHNTGWEPVRQPSVP